MVLSYFLKKKKDFIYLFLDRGEGRDGNINVWLPFMHHPHTRDLAHKPGTHPDWESNWQPFGSQAGTQSTEPHQPGPYVFSVSTESRKENSLLCLINDMRALAFS